ncbi:MAG: M23 family metallopeptidase [Acidobacteria bacterium]|nr:M23 family metallopeptidase [Acidobacteriota bacterium]
MKKLAHFFKKAFTSITIMVIPHDNHRSMNLKVPVAGIVVPLLLAAFGSGYLFYLAMDGLEYKALHYAMAEKVDFYSRQFNQWGSTVTALKTVEGEFRQLFSLESKDEVLENVDTSFIGSLEIPDLIDELKKTINTVEEIKDYLSTQKDIYVATPKGYPASGRISSPYGKRKDPFSGEIAFHSGIDISSKLGSPIRATADGVVSHSGWTNRSGFVIVIEHGCGFSTLYAHNKSNTVKIGTRVKRGDIIGYVGSTGKSTGPHVHYEVWKNRKTVDAQKYVSSKS